MAVRAATAIGQNETFGVISATSVAIGGATIGTNALAVTGMSALNFGTLGVGSTASGLSVIGTFNDAGTTFNGALLLNVTNTASNGNSLLLDLQASAASKFKVQVNGQITSSAGATLGGTLDVTNNQIRTVGSLNLGSGNTGTLTSPGAATVQQGAADVDTAPVAQTTRTQGALAGGTSNVAGANWTFIASPGKGTGAGGSLIFQTAPAGSTGTVVNAPVTALTIDSKGLLIGGTFFTAATLPAAAAGNKGARSFISDAAAAPVFGAVVTGSGSLYIPVFSDGTNWRNG